MNSSGFSVAMLGGRGVGKTSMLAAMCHDFESSIDESSLELVADDQTQYMLDQRLAELMQVTENSETLIDTRTTGGTAAPTEYRFELTHFDSLSGSASEFDITFHDYPGGYLSDPTNHAYVRSVLVPASVILVAIDAPALMQLLESGNEKINKTACIKNTLASVLKERSDLRRLIIFVPMRCEKWLNSNQAELMYEAFRIRYAASLRLLSYFKSSIDVLYGPIQTLGSVQFKCYRDHLAMFERVRNQTYSPKDCEQILRHSIRHLLVRCEYAATKLAEEAKESIAQMPWWKLVYSKLGDKFGLSSEAFRNQRRGRELSEAMARSLEVFSEKCKNDAPFKWIQEVPRRQSETLRQSNLNHKAGVGS